MADVEDFSSTTTPPPHPRRAAVHPRARDRAHRAPSPTRADASGLGEGPVGGRIWVKAFGCAHSVADGEAMAGVLAAAGFDLITCDADADTAHAWVLNSCTVKTPSQHGIGKASGWRGGRESVGE